MINIKPQDIDDVDLAFPTGIGHLMPDMDNLPEDIANRSSKWCKVTSDWFFVGLHNVKWTPKKGIDTKKALRHIGTILGSWEPKHEDKEAAVAYLLSIWFHKVIYKRGR